VRPADAPRSNGVHFVNGDIQAQLIGAPRTSSSLHKNLPAKKDNPHRPRWEMTTNRIIFAISPPEIDPV